MNANEIIQKFLGSPAARKIEVEAAQEVHAGRRQLCQQLDALRADEVREVDRLGRAAEDARRAVATAQAALRKAEGGLTAILTAARDVQSTTFRQAGRLEAQLRASADPRLAGFARWTIDEEDRTRAELSFRGSTRTRRIMSRWTGRPEDVTTPVWNTLEIRARLAMLRQARARAEALQLEALSADEITRALDKLRAGIPKLEELDEERATALLAAAAESA